MPRCIFISKTRYPCAEMYLIVMLYAIVLGYRISLHRYYTVLVHSFAFYILISQRIKFEVSSNVTLIALVKEKERDRGRKRGRQISHENIVARMQFARCNREQFVRFASRRGASTGK